MANKLYKSMSQDEQIELIGKIADYVNKDLPILLQIKVFKKEDKEKFFRGVSLLAHFPQCLPFYNLAKNTVSNFPQFSNTLANQFRAISRQLSAGTQMRNADGGNVVVIQKPQQLRRGRPTEAESRQREEEKQKEARAMAIASLTGAKVAVAEAEAVEERESDTSRRKTQEADLFSQAVEAETSSIINASGNEAEEPGVELKNLKAWSWILPEPLATNVGLVKGIRADIAANSERAKQLMLDGADEMQIKVYTEKAKELNRDLDDIFFGVDMHLAIDYALLTKVNKDYGKWAERYAKRGGYDVLVADLKPYYDKLTTPMADGKCLMSADDILAHAQKLEDARIKAETKDPAKEKEIHAIKSYFSRKDVQPSAARLQKMKEKYDRAKELGVDADSLAGFEVFIAKIESDLKAE